MTITEVSEKYGLSADTLRYYERIGLIPAVTRANNGIRDYSDKDCGWVEFIKCMRSAGLSIESLIEYVRLFQEGAGTRDARKELLIEEREKLIEHKNLLLSTIERLNYKIDNYDKIMGDGDAPAKKTEKCTSGK